MLVAAVLLLVSGLPTARARAAGWRDRPALIGLAGLVGALLAPFHFFFFPAFLLIALGWVLIGGRLVDRDAPRNAALLLAPYLLAVPFAAAALSQATRQRRAQAGRRLGIGAVRGWTVRPSLFFYLTNLGIPFAARPARARSAARPAPRLPGVLGGGALPGAERRAGERRSAST